VKYLVTVVLLSSIIYFPVFGEKRKADFQKGQILKAEKLPGRPTNVDAASDAPPEPGVYRYNVFSQIGNTVYTTQLETFDPMDAEFPPGSEVQARVSKRILYLKRASGNVEEARIVGKKKAEANQLKALVLNRCSRNPYHRHLVPDSVLLRGSRKAPFGSL